MTRDTGNEIVRHRMNAVQSIYFQLQKRLYMNVFFNNLKQTFATESIKKHEIQYAHALAF